MLLIHVKVNQDDSQMMILKLEEHEDVDEDENEEEMNVSIIHHKQTLFKNIKINFQINQIFLLCQVVYLNSLLKLVHQHQD